MSDTVKLINEHPLATKAKVDAWWKENEEAFKKALIGGDIDVVTNEFSARMIADLKQAD